MRRSMKMTHLAIWLCLFSLAGSVWFVVRQDTFFNSKVWKDAPLKDSSDSYVRQKMVDDLLLRYKLVGMKRTELEQLLGQPDNSGYVENYNSYSYILGPERGIFGIDYEYLSIKFKGGKVIAAEIFTD